MGRYSVCMKDEKDWRSKTLKSNIIMDGKNKRNTHTIAHTERKTSGCNWELFKSIVRSDSSESNAKKENIPKKSQRPKMMKKCHMSLANGVKQLHVEEKVLDEQQEKLTKHIAMDCEMVGIGDGRESMIARVSIVNRFGYCVYDKYVKAREPVKDYRTKVSGIYPHHLQNGEEFDVVQKAVAEILKGRILIGHALKHDLDVLFLSHPRKHMRDTSRFKVFRQLCRGNTPSLKRLAYELLDKEIQTGEHSSVEDARAAMQLYMLYKNKWESGLYSK